MANDREEESGNINWAYFPSQYISVTNQRYYIGMLLLQALVYYECHFRIFENSIVDVMSAEIKICHYPQPKSMVRSLGFGLVLAHFKMCHFYTCARAHTHMFFSQCLNLQSMLIIHAQHLVSRSVNVCVCVCFLIHSLI